MAIFRATRLGLAILGWLAASAALAAPPWETLLPFKKVDANPGNAYRLSTEQGPWLVLAASFSGERAEQQAHELVLELRTRFHLTAYTHQQTYDFTQPVEGNGFDENGNRKMMRHNVATRYDTFAVLVGDFSSVDDPSLEKSMEKIKFSHPECLDLRKRPQTAQKYEILRDFYRRVGGDENRKKGPMGMAFATRNPLLPEEMFVSGGLDQFVVDMNDDLDFSLLKCQGQYSVRVATFRGKGTMELKKMETMEVSSELDKAAEKAHKLTLALRKKGVDAYEFHDRHESIVTVGSFDSVGTPRPDGKTELNPAIHQIMEAYGADRTPLPGVNGQLGLRPKSLDKIPFDAQPLPVETPKISLGAAYSNGNRPLQF